MLPYVKFAEDKMLTFLNFPWKKC